MATGGNMESETEIAMLTVLLVTFKSRFPFLSAALVRLPYHEQLQKIRQNRSEAMWFGEILRVDSQEVDRVIRQWSGGKNEKN